MQSQKMLLENGANRLVQCSVCHKPSIYKNNSVFAKHNKMWYACVPEKALMYNILDKYKALMLTSSLHTKMIPVFLQILNLQLVLALRENWLWVFLKAPWQDAPLPVPNVNSSISVYNSWERKWQRGWGAEENAGFRGKPAVTWAEEEAKQKHLELPSLTR